MKQYLEYLYLVCAIVLMGVYAIWGKNLETVPSYGILAAILLFSFLFSIRRTLRRAAESKSKPNNTQNGK